MKRLLVFLLLLSPAAASAQLYHPGDELRYSVSYRAKFFPNTEVATVTVRTSEEEFEGKKVRKVVGHGKTLPTYRLFFTLDDSYTLRIDPATLRTLEYESDVREGSYTFRSRFDYDWERLQVSTRWTKREETEQRKTMPLTRESMDAVSLFFNMRSASTDQFREGEQRTLQMVLEDTIRYLNYRFVGREVKKIRTMGKFRTLKFACQIGTSEGYSFTDGDEFFIWISDDRNKIPLWLESPIRIGSICAYITGTKGLKYPLESKIK